ncbi:hypothetical protein C343_02429 [Cryptococcus neoformans C23]|uniref:SET domain-containing protein n=1 Tax=Cryptococcus neoformans (strain H99 / ATCC 208821 / CBS 10515 / FGSC 9487) TaxID=235443 RepID=J9VIS5_CRYN9|nr:hypothetical protein CNAG_05087 [Cryptococcus neoformans var. grubii H99]AFR94352.2 hypothetical protein CNAG_05087 [Cryptococcus neoformans var. grubii H99]AUB23998.1 hypothetical protein CKF44_05087 [Cryptococcus neoformans var. grubii]OWZ33470.1 hypothetical protein C347_02497 [Cryptococcus neoformans var. grubii AD2-60a]OWZ45566.1 hypothetical protein C343_02429 [Cryptococcus neoformans var. grubii C23]|eukprot:XP_012048494.1 hypothetical protein CNAG_05087 [Cryptococcus neoformans var. grubii H99]
MENDEEKSPEYEEIMTIVRKVLSCSFTLYGADAAPVGLCISPVISNIAHDCRPNAQIVFPLGAIANGGMKIVAVESIHPGEEVRISYVPPTMPCYQRGLFLEKYGFQHDAECSVCSASLLLDIRWAAKHYCRGTKSNDHGYQSLLRRITLASVDGEREEVVSGSPTACTHCGAVGEAKDINQIWAAEALAVMRPFQTLEEEGHYLSDSKDVDLKKLEYYHQRLLEGYSSSTYPIPLLTYRLAGLQLHVGEAHGDPELLFRGIETLNRAFHALSRVSDNVISFQLFWLVFRMVRARMYICERLKGEYSAKPPGYKIHDHVIEQVHAAGQWLEWLCDYERALPLDGRTRNRVRALREQATELGHWASEHGTAGRHA